MRKLFKAGSNTGRRRAAVFILAVFFCSCPLYADAVGTLRAGHHNYIDAAGARMIHGAHLNVAFDFLFGGFFAGVFVDGTYALSSPNFILCKPGVDLGYMFRVRDLFYMFAIHGAPVFHNETYISPNIDTAIGAEFRNYTRLGENKNLFFVFGFAADYYFRRQNMAYTISVGLGCEVFFNKAKALPPREAFGSSEEARSPLEGVGPPSPPPLVPAQTPVQAAQPPRPSQTLPRPAQTPPLPAQSAPRPSASSPSPASPSPAAGSSAARPNQVENGDS